MLGAHGNVFRRRGARFDVLGRPVGGAPQGMLAGRGRSTFFPGSGFSGGGFSGGGFLDGEESSAVVSLNHKPSRIHKPRIDTSAADARRAIAYMNKGRQAEAEGKPHVAKIYYRMVAKRGGTELKQQAADRLAAIEAAATPARIATRD